MEENIIEKLKRILLSDPEIKEKWDDLIHITSVGDALKTFKLLYFFIKKLVYIVEYVQVTYSAMTKEERIEVASDLMDDLIKFSGWAVFLEAFDGMIFKLIISQVVAGLDDRYGSGNWFLNDEAVLDIDADSILVDISDSEFNTNEGMS